jgi:ribulose-5-phosphate 4-epimerase/fuculose-1-phosphate aldolase
MDRDEVFRKIRAVGQAALTIAIENSHSGNISVKCRDESGIEVMAITATGSQKGELTPDRICFLTLTETNYGYFKASAESEIHARILQIPGVNATMHGHTKMATIVTMDDAPPPKENPRPPLLPIDPLGTRYLGWVPVDWYEVASGSPEMTETISKRLASGPVCIVQAHGAFARGASLEEALFYLCLLEHSGEVIFFSKMLNTDLESASKRADELGPALLQVLPDYPSDQDMRRDFEDEPDTIDMFLKMGFRIFESRYSPFHTGSMSIRAARSMMYLPKASMPRELPGPMLEVSLDSASMSDLDPELRSLELDLHRTIYLETPLKSLLHCYIAEAQVLALAAPEETPGKITRILPLDVEGGFLYPAIPVLEPRPDPEDLCRALLDYRIAIVKFGGVWAAGEQSVGEALRHISSTKDICLYRILAKMRGLDISAMESKWAKTW